MIACVIAATAAATATAAASLLLPLLCLGPGIGALIWTSCCHFVPRHAELFPALIRIKRKTAHGQRCKTQFVADEVIRRGREKKEAINATPPTYFQRTKAPK